MNRRGNTIGIRIGAVALAVASPALLAGCGDDADAGSGDGLVRDGVLTVELSDFRFGELPDSVPAGTRLTVENTSTVELHELVAVRLDDDDDRPVDEIVGGDLGALFAAGPPAAVVLAAPGGGEPIPAVGDGTLTEPGRYLLVCMIPTGADPAEYLAAAAAASDGPPKVPGGPPHVAHGMYAELEVTS